MIHSSFHGLFEGSEGVSNVADYFAALPVGSNSPSSVSYQPSGDVDTAAPFTMMALTAKGASGAVASGFSGSVGEVATFGGGTAGERKTEAGASGRLDGTVDTSKPMFHELFC